MFSKESQTTRKRKNMATPKPEGNGRRGRPAGAINKTTLDMLEAAGIDVETYIKVREIMRFKRPKEVNADLVETVAADRIQAVTDEEVESDNIVVVETDTDDLIETHDEATI